MIYYAYDKDTGMYLYRTESEIPKYYTNNKPHTIDSKWDGTKWIDQQPPKQSVQDQIDQLKMVDGVLGGQIAQLIARQ